MAKSGRKPNVALTIGVDCGALSQQPEENYGGIYTLAVNLLVELGRLDKRNHYLLYSFAPISKELMRQFGREMKNIVLRPRLGYKTVWLPLALKLQAADAFMALSQAVPRGAPPILGFIYDLAFLKYPNAYIQPAKLKHNTDEIVRESAHLITLSEASKTDIIKRYRLDNDRVTVAYPGVERIFRPRGPKFIDTKPYFLYVGALKKTKNIPKLIEGFVLFRRGSQKDFKLLLVGSLKDMDPEVTNTITRLKLAKRVVLKGYVDRFDLPKYYRGAIALVTPALYEGFGLPLVEAMASGCPVVAAKNSSMPEVMGKFGIMVSASKPEEITKAMQKLVDDSQYRIKMITAGFRQARRFNNRNFARIVLKNVYWCLKKRQIR